MNLPSPTNPKSQTNAPGSDGATLGDVNFCEESLCEFAEWMDRELAALHLKFADFVTTKSRKRSLGR